MLRSTSWLPWEGEESLGVSERQGAAQSSGSRRELPGATQLGASLEPRPRGPAAGNRPSRGLGGAGGLEVGAALPCFQGPGGGGSGRSVARL